MDEYKSIVREKELFSNIILWITKFCLKYAGKKIGLESAKEQAKLQQFWKDNIKVLQKLDVNHIMAQANFNKLKKARVEY